MSWRLAWAPRALKDLRKLDPGVATRIVTALERYAATGVGNVITLTDIEPAECRLRVGKWRARFQPDSATRTLVVLRVLPRDKAY